MDSIIESNHTNDQQDNDEKNSDEKIQESIDVTESEQTDTTTGNTTNEDSPETDCIQSSINPTNMITAEASFTEATAADLPLGALRSSVARILVKPGQIFRVQVDNEVKEVHGKSPKKKKYIIYPDVQIFLLLLLLLLLFYSIIYLIE